MDAATASAAAASGVSLFFDGTVPAVRPPRRRCPPSLPHCSYPLMSAHARAYCGAGIGPVELVRDGVLCAAGAVASVAPWPAHPGPSASSPSACPARASSLAMRPAHADRAPQKHLADVAIRGERFVGVDSGGCVHVLRLSPSVFFLCACACVSHSSILGGSGSMDQSISLMAERGQAKRIDFAPLQATAVPLPPDAVFVIANSLVTSDKQGAAVVLRLPLRLPAQGQTRHPPTHPLTHAPIGQSLRPTTTTCGWPSAALPHGCCTRHSN
jgi:hypothetical protein